MGVILGINAYHGDSAACLVVDGRLVAAAEEERFRRIKHWAGFPAKSVAYCLSAGGCRLEDVDHVALNSDPRANLVKKFGYAVRKRPELRLVLDRLRAARKRASAAEELERSFPGARFRGRVHGVEHHRAHLVSAFHVSPFERAVVVSVDGFGDFASAAWGVGDGNSLTIDDQVHFPHSLGIFYQALTQYLGFPHYGDEYKVMGLAPYGSPTMLPLMRQVVNVQTDGAFRLNLGYFRHGTEHVDYEWDGGAPSVGRLFSDALVELLGPVREVGTPLEQRHRDLARSVQGMYEEAFFALLTARHAEHPLSELALAGGCAMNSVANGKITRRTPFEHVYVQSAAGDAGGALGAALDVAVEIEETVPRGQMHHAYWGPAFTDAQIRDAIAVRRPELDAAGCGVREVADAADLCRATAAHIADGLVVGWFQGRMEWGPRALGNRSILGDPRRADMKDILNLKIKRRESFRPFAPSVLRESVDAWFEQSADVPFMMQVLDIRSEMRERIPAVTHVDGTGRLQTVTPEGNLLYYHLISAFADLTGVPMLLNTSFNENEPVVCRPSEALDCFLRTEMDVLVLGCTVVERATAGTDSARESE